MEKRIKRKWALAAALALGGCSHGAGSSAPADDDGAWMDGADVVVRLDATAGRETVTLVDPASGFAQVVDDEPLTPGVTEWDEPAEPIALAAALAGSPAK